MVNQSESTVCKGPLSNIAQNDVAGLFKLSQLEQASVEAEEKETDKQNNENLSRGTESHANFDFDKYLLQTSHNGSDLIEIPVKKLMQPINSKKMHKKSS